MLANAGSLVYAARYPKVQKAVAVLALVLLSAWLGYQVARDYFTAVELMVAAAIVAVSIRWPRQALLMAVPATLLPIDLVGTSGQLLIVAALTIGWLVEMLAGRGHVYPWEHGLLAGFGAWLVLAYFVDGVHIESQLSAEHDLATLLAGLWLCGMAISIGPTRGQLLAVGALSAAAVSVAAILDPAHSGVGRIALLGLNSNYVGAALALGAVASLAALIHNRRNPIWIATGVACVIGIRASGSRGAIVMLLAGVAVLGLLGRPRWIQLTVVAVAATVVIALPGFTDEALTLLIGPRTAADFAASNIDRTNAGLTALRYAVANPVFGVGYGQFAALAARDPLLAEYVATHNDYLRLAAESGFPAALLLIAVVGLALRTGRPLRRTETAMVVTYAVSLLFGNFLSNLSVSAPFWLWLGLSLHVSAERSAATRETAREVSIRSQGAAMRTVRFPAE
jgi:O-antigen ligase